MRSFDPAAVGRLETDAWVTYYQRRWAAFLRASIGLVRAGFDLGPIANLRGAWLVLRANQLWAPYPDNDPDGARRCMRRFYELVKRKHGESFDPAKASELEVEWWRVHRELQHDRSAEDDAPLVEALSNLYAYIYGVQPASATIAARERAATMRDSDRWVAEGCQAHSPLIDSEREALIRSYAALRETISA